MLSSPASGNYLFHEGRVTSVYLGQKNRERIVTSPPFWSCLRRRFSSSPGAAPKDQPQSRVHASAACSQMTQAGARRAPAPARPADPRRHTPSSQPPAPQIAAAPTKLQHLFFFFFKETRIRFAAELWHGSLYIKSFYTEVEGAWRRALGETSAKGISRPSASAVTAFRCWAPRGALSKCP